MNKFSEHPVGAPITTEKTDLWSGPFSDLVGYVINKRPDGSFAVTLEVKEEKHFNQFQVSHGGVAMTLLDVAGGAAVHSLDMPYCRVATISVTVNFLQGGAAGPMIALGKVTGHGKSIAYTDMTLHQGDENGPVVASAKGIYRIFLQRDDNPQDK